MSKITFDDKVVGQPSPIGFVRAVDINEIKEVVNSNDDDLTTASQDIDTANQNIGAIKNPKCVSIPFVSALDLSNINAKTQGQLASNQTFTIANLNLVDSGNVVVLSIDANGFTPVFPGTNIDIGNTWDLTAGQINQVIIQMIGTQIYNLILPSYTGTLNNTSIGHETLTLTDTQNAIIVGGISSILESLSLTSTQNATVISNAGQALESLTLTSTQDASIVVSGPSYANVYNAFSTKPDAGLQESQATFYNTLLSNGIIAKLDRLYIHANNTVTSDALIDWIHPGTIVAINHGNTFTASQGFQGNGTSSYLDLNFNPSTQAVNFKLNANSLFLYSRTSTFSGSGIYLLGAIDGGFGFDLSKSGTTGLSGRNNANALQTYKASMTDYSGFYVITRVDASTVNVYRNGVKSILSYASSGIPTVGIIESGVAATIPQSFTGLQISMIGIGDQLTDADELVIRNAFQTLMTYMGTQVTLN